MTLGSLFSGIGGFELGLIMSGLCTPEEIIWQVEIDKFCNKVLEKNFPNAKRYGDIKDVGKHNLDPVDIICGGFPCQPFSVAGKRKGKADDRFLWPEMLRVIAELNPAFIIGENVFGIVNMELDKVLSDLESIGYETATFIIPACAVNAPHRRDRIFVIAHSRCKHGARFSDRGKFERQIPCAENAVMPERPVGNDEQGINTYTDIKRKLQPQGIIGKKWGWSEYSQHSQKYQSRNKFRQTGRKRTFGRGIYESMWQENWVEVATRLCRVDDGVSNRVHRLKALGNAVVPPLVCAIGEIIKDYLSNKK